IVPYVKQPEEIIPGRPLYFATSMPQPGSGLSMGLLVESHMGRPTKIEGNPEHPASLGSTDLFAQASVLELYDPDRSQMAVHLGVPRSWDSFCAEMVEPLNALRALKGEGLAVVTPSFASATLERQIGRLKKTFPKARVFQWEAMGRNEIYEGARRAFGADLELTHDFSKAEVVLALQSDFLTQGPSNVRDARDFMSRRRIRDGQTEMNRLYVAESTPTSTGTVADHRFVVSPSELEGFALAIAAQLGVKGLAPVPDSNDGAWTQEQARIVAADLARHRGKSIVIAGEHAPSALQVLVHAMNDRLGNLGSTVLLSDTPLATLGNPHAELAELTAAMQKGEVDLCFLLGVNPVFDSPGDLDFAQALSQVKTRVHLGLHEDETSLYCHWQLPMNHYLESWSDGVAFDGTPSIGQPLIDPLYEGHSIAQLLEFLINGNDSIEDMAIVQSTWRERHGKTGFDAWWRKALHDGLAGEAQRNHSERSLRAGAVEGARKELAQPTELAVLLRPDPTIFDGRFANSGWLQECPKPITRLTWDNAALMAPKLAQEHQLSNGDRVRIEYEGRSIEIPIWIVPGHAEKAVTVHLGYGRTQGGHVAKDAGVDAYPLRSSTAPWILSGVSLSKVGGRVKLACTQDHQTMEGRDLLRVGTLEGYRDDPEQMAHAHESETDSSKSLYPGWDYSEGYAWGMAIDLTACTGCNACVMACVSENNIAVVGKEQVLNAREMHWIRIDRYFEGELDGADVVNQPVVCMQCEQAPCEPVCPVGATSHSAEGLNDMVYNRCVGTRYCSNNCPYKVRRFNFLAFGDHESESLKMQRNPDVTVRMRGVMEKCTYCVQRINGAKIDAQREDREVRDGEITTACQQVCPTRAISFGNINDKNSEVSHWKSNPLNYGLLTELGTRPRTSYLAKLRNPNPELTDVHHG
ncbi:MAG TPA: 4Fe-4S dicluster domain-containing protein, partial [Candidatus Krumholzibacteria bacterium]|nr:4Fe-4S dicluster domain-containing protein [Candidatus Krumholzibacteria bacterium]